VSFDATGKKRWRKLDGRAWLQKVHTRIARSARFEVVRYGLKGALEGHDVRIVLDGTLAGQGDVEFPVEAGVSHTATVQGFGEVTFEVGEGDMKWLRLRADGVLVEVPSDVRA
jgi:hypothetical protein